MKNTTEVPSYSLALGRSAIVRESAAMALGNHANAVGAGSIAIGQDTAALSSGSLAMAGGMTGTLKSDTSSPSNDNVYENDHKIALFSGTGNTSGTNLSDSGAWSFNVTDLNAYSQRALRKNGDGYFYTAGRATAIGEGSIAYNEYTIALGTNAIAGKKFEGLHIDYVTDPVTGLTLYFDSNGNVVPSGTSGAKKKIAGIETIIKKRLIL